MDRVGGRGSELAVCASGWVRKVVWKETDLCLYTVYRAIVRMYLRVWVVRIEDWEESKETTVCRGKERDRICGGENWVRGRYCIV